MLQTTHSSRSYNRSLVNFHRTSKLFTSRSEDGAMELQHYDFHDPGALSYSPQQVATGGLIMQPLMYQGDAPHQLDAYSVSRKHVPGFQAPPQPSQWLPLQVEGESGTQPMNAEFSTPSQWDAVGIDCNTEKDCDSNQAIVDGDPHNWFLQDMNGVSDVPDMQRWSAIGLGSWDSPNAPSEPSDAEGSFTYSADFDQTSPPPLFFDTGTTPYPEPEGPVSPEESVRPEDLGQQNEPVHQPYNDDLLRADLDVLRGQGFLSAPVYSTRFNPQVGFANGHGPVRYLHREPSLSYSTGPDAVAYSNLQNAALYSNGHFQALYPVGNMSVPYPNGEVPVSSVEDIWVPQGPDSFSQSTSPPANQYLANSRPTTSPPANHYPNFSPPQPNPYPSLTPQHQHSATPPIQQARSQRLPSTQPSYRPIDNERNRQDAILLQGKAAGLTYKEIKTRIGVPIAESTLRGRYRSLTKERKDRVRKPMWTPKDIRLLTAIVNNEMERVDDASYRALSRDQRLNKLSWKRVSDYIANNGGSYHFGNSTCKKKWKEIEENEDGM